VRNIADEYSNQMGKAQPLHLIAFNISGQSPQMFTATIFRFFEIHFYYDGNRLDVQDEAVDLTAETHGDPSRVPVKCNNFHGNVF
jgi:hypothetical protein